MGWSPLLSNRWPYRRHKSDKKEENYLIHLTMLFPSHWTFSPLATSHDSAWSTCINTILIVLDIFSTDPGFQQLLIDSHRSRRLISNSNYFFNDFFYCCWIFVKNCWFFVKNFSWLCIIIDYCKIFEVLDSCLLRDNPNNMMSSWNLFLW